MVCWGWAWVYEPGICQLQPVDAPAACERRMQLRGIGRLH